jgi:aminoglycoside/choline kinase family phosphotransferase
MKSQIINRSERLKRFVDNHFSNIKYTIKPIIGDAGLRDYLRVSTDDASYIIMDCPPSYTSIEPFIQIAEVLTQNGFSAPEIVNSDINNGFLILQDFGKLSVKNYLMNDNKTQQAIYHLSIDLLIKLQDTEPQKNLKTFDNALLASELSIFTDFYAPYKKGMQLDASDLEDFKILWQDFLLKQVPMQNSIVLRDYHVENMMYLEHEDGINKLGLLDFQDALIGSPLYDLVSILEDARIDISRDFALECVQYYALAKNIDLEDALVNYHILGAQRNLRILGIFARKYTRDKDDTYLQYIPRVLKYLEYDVSHPVLEPLKNWLLKTQII